jgi:6,7-dimethyl-8-ribityllumazine synthase
MASKGNENLTLENSEIGVEGSTVVVIKTAWNSHITEPLNKGCVDMLASFGINVIEVTVPGAVELTFAAAHYAKTIPNIHACIVLGCVIRGDTPHFDFVCQSVTQGITLLNTQLSTPVIFGVLTVNTEEQALERIGGKHGHKGEEAALTAIRMVAFVGNT